MATETAKRKKARQKYQNGLAFINSSFNNTLITFTSPSGDVLSWSSAGACKFKGSRKGTPFAAQSASAMASRSAHSIYGVRSVIVYISGPGPGRESAIRAIEANGIEIAAIRDITPIPHNGCRPPKRRRV